MRKRRLIFILLFAALCAALSACGTQPPPDPPHTHSFTEVPLLPATCEADGVKAHKKCTDCGKLFLAGADGELSEADEASLTIPAFTAHNLVIVPENAPTCSKIGNRSYRKCTLCGRTFPLDRDDEGTEADFLLPIDPATHRAMQTVPEVPATCEADGVKTHKKCNDCGKLFLADSDGNLIETDEAALVILSFSAHNLIEVPEIAPACNKTGNLSYRKCTVCKRCFFPDRDDEGTEADFLLPIDPAAHRALQTVPEVPATCETDGVKAHKKCNDCGKLFLAGSDGNLTETDEAALLISSFTAHNLAEVPENTPTCSKIGNIAHQKCTLCKRLFSLDGEDELSESEAILPARGSHEINQDGVCKTCGARPETIRTSGDKWNKTNKQTVNPQLAANPGTFAAQTKSGASSALLRENALFCTLRAQQSEKTSTLFFRHVAAKEKGTAFVGRYTLIFDFAVTGNANGSATSAETAADGSATSAATEPDNRTNGAAAQTGAGNSFTSAAGNSPMNAAGEIPLYFGFSLQKYVAADAENAGIALIPAEDALRTFTPGKVYRFILSVTTDGEAEYVQFSLKNAAGFGAEVVVFNVMTAFEEEGSQTAALEFSMLETDRTPQVYDKTRPTYDVISLNCKVTNANDTGNKRWQVRCPLIADYLKDLAPDVVLLQEVAKSQYEDLKTLLPDYASVWYGRSTGSNPEGLAIFFSSRFSLTKETRFYLSETPDSPALSGQWGAAYERFAVHATLYDSVAKKPLEVFNAHLDNSSKQARENGIALIASRANATGHNSVIAGDFNTDSGSKCYKTLARNFTDAQAAAPDSDSGLSYHNYGNGTGWTTNIDFIFCSKTLTALEFRIRDEKAPGGIYYSDHYAVWAKLTLS